MDVLKDVASFLSYGFRAHRPVALTESISIGMAAHGSAAMTYKALDALFASASGDFELILVDDASPDDTLDVFLEARKWHGNTRIFAFRENLEYCNSVNAFLSHAHGECLIFLSNDILVCPAYLRELLRAAAANPACGILHGCSNFVDNLSPLHNIDVERFETRAQLFSFGAKVASEHRKSPPVDERYLVGDAFLVTRPVIDRIGTLDTRFVGYYGDQDFGLRARIAGFRMALVRSAFAFHAKDANITYLADDERQAKLARRHRRVGEALGQLVRKYDLHLSEASVEDIPWEELARQKFERARHYVPPKDYSAYLLPQPGSGAMTKIGNARTR